MNVMNSDDFADILRAWPFEPGKLAARVVDRGEQPPRLQVRVELGLLQLESQGRPDGLRPEGLESLFHAALHRAQAAQTVLSSAECEALHREAALFSYRSLVFSTLEDYRGVLRDTERNLEVMNFIIAHAAEARERDNARRSLLQLITMRARALATVSVRSGDVGEARSALDNGIENIQEVMHELGRAGDFEDSHEVRLLKGMRDMLVPRLPASQRQEMRERLEAAIALENYELAAILTAELRQLP